MLHKNLINGEWVEGQGKDNINPSDISDVVGTYAQATAQHAKHAIDAAAAAFPAWSQSTPQQRADVLEFVGVELLARKDEIGKLLAREEGKPLANGVAETMRAAQIFKFFAQEALRLEGVAVPSVRPGVDVLVTREALGVVGLICPWNFPIAIPAWKLAPALAFGLGIGRNHFTLWLAQGGVQPGDGARLRGWAGTFEQSKSGSGIVYGFSRHRSQSRAGLCLTWCEVPTGDGRQEPARCSGRRQSGCCRRRCR
jgi:hypothetical protein